MGKRAAVLAAVVCWLGLGLMPAAAADQVLVGARHLRLTPGHDVQASALDGAIRRTMTVTSADISVLADVPTGQPDYVEMSGVTEGMPPYYRAAAVRIHVSDAKHVDTVVPRDARAARR